MSVNPRHDHQLRLFVAVANARSLREAAEIIGMTQPGLSKQIRLLEEVLHKQLFRRHGRGMQLTAEGRALLLDVEPLFHRLDAVIASGHGGSPVRTFRLAAVQTLVASFMPNFCKALLDVYPDLSLSVHCESSSNVVESVERDRVDLAFVYDAAVDAPDLASVELFDERLALYVRAGRQGDSDSLADLAKQRIIAPPRRYAVRRAIERALAAPLEPFIECDSLELSLRLVAVTDGVTILPLGLPTDMVEGRGLRRLPLPSIAARRIVALVRKRQIDAPLVALAIAIARRVADQER